MTRDRDRHDEHDARLEALLRDALREEAETVVPTGDGLSRIQHDIRARRARRRWLQPALALGSAAALVLVGVGAYALVNNDNGHQTVKVPPAQSPTPTEEPSTPTIADEQFPQQAIFPFTSAAEEATWDKSYDEGHSPWQSEPKAVALMWVNNILGLPSIDTIISAQQDTADTGSVTLGRVINGESGKPVKMTVVHLARYGHAWIVVGATDPAGLLKFDTPSAGDKVSSPVQVTGPGGWGVDESMQVDVRDAETPTSYGTGRTSFGNGTREWQVGVTFGSPSSGVGTLLAVVDSQADGGPQRLAAQQVRFASTAPAGNEPPKYFYAVKDQRVAQFSSRDGAATQFLTDAEPGGGAEDPQLSADGAVVYYLQGGGTCSNALMSVTVQGHETSTVAAPPNGYVIAGFGVGPQRDGTAGLGKGNPPVALYETACDSQTAPQAKLVMQNPDGTTSTVKFPSLPPMVVADPTWENDAQHVDAIVHGGTENSLVRYDATTGRQSGNACPGYAASTGEPEAVEVAGGELWFVVRTGSSMQALKCGADGQVHPMATISGNDQPVDLAVTGDGQWALVTDGAGAVWRWDGSGTPTRLHPSVPLTHVTW